MFESIIHTLLAVQGNIRILIIIQMQGFCLGGWGMGGEPAFFDQLPLPFKSCPRPIRP